MNNPPSRSVLVTSPTTWEKGAEESPFPVSSLAQTNPLSHLQILRNAYDLSPVASVSIDENGNILLANRKFFDLLHCKEGPQSIQNLFSVECKSESPTLKQAIQSARNHHSWDGELLLLQGEHNPSTGPKMEPSSPSAKPSPTHPSVSKPMVSLTTHIESSQHSGESETPLAVYCCTFAKSASSTTTVPSASSSSPQRKSFSYQTLLQTLPVGMCLWTCQQNDAKELLFQLSSINPLAEKVLGVSITPGAYLHEVVDLQDNPGVQEFFRSIVERKEIVFHPKFTLGYGQFSLTAFPMEPCQLGLLLEPCRTDESTKEALFQLDQSMTAFCIVDGNQNEPLRVTYGNFGFLNLSGLKTEEMERPLKKVLDTTDPDTKIAMEGILAREMGRGTVQLKNKFRKNLTVHLSYIPMKNTIECGRKSLLVFENRAMPLLPNLGTCSPRGGEGLFEQIFESLDTCAMVLSLDGVASQCRLVALNKKAKSLPFIKNKLAHEIDRFLFDIFPNLAESGIYEVFQEVVSTDTPRYLGVVPFFDSDSSRMVDGNFVTKVFPIQQTTEKYVLVLFEDTTEGEPSPSSPFGDSQNPSPFETYHLEENNNGPLPSLVLDGNLPPQKRLRTPMGESPCASGSQQTSNSATLFKEIVEDLNAPILTMTMDGYIQYANPAFASLLGFRDPAEMPHRQLVHLLEHPLEIEYVVGLLKRFAVNEVTQFSMDLQFRGQLRSGISCSSKFSRAHLAAQPTIVLTARANN